MTLVAATIPVIITAASGGRWAIAAKGEMQHQRKRDADEQRFRIVPHELDGLENHLHVPRYHRLKAIK